MVTRICPPLLVGFISWTNPSANVDISESYLSGSGDAEMLSLRPSSGAKAQKATARDPRAMRRRTKTIFSSLCIIMKIALQ